MDLDLDFLDTEVLDLTMATLEAITEDFTEAIIAVLVPEDICQAMDLEAITSKIAKLVHPVSFIFRIKSVFIIVEQHMRGLNARNALWPTDKIIYNTSIEYDCSLSDYHNLSKLILKISL